MKISEKFEGKSGVFWISITLLLIGLVGFVNYVVGYEISISLFYVLPISLITWYTRKSYGIGASLLCALVWLCVGIWSTETNFHIAIFIWNSSIRFGFFCTIVFLLSNLKKSYLHEQELARVDNLTGAFNRRYFFELMQYEINRSQRNKQPFTIVYFDLDNFKYVNDKQGHNEGDKVLMATVKIAKQMLRKIDVIGRLGGDEFAFLLPETNEPSAKIAINKINKGLLEEMQKNNWPITFSMGVFTCLDPHVTNEELIKQADELMYTVKKAGKNSISYSVSKLANPVLA